MSVRVFRGGSPIDSEQALERVVDLDVLKITIKLLPMFFLLRVGSFLCTSNMNLVRVSVGSIVCETRVSGNEPAATTSVVGGIMVLGFGLHVGSSL